MRLMVAPYSEQQAGRPASGQALLAQYADTSIVVYRAYRPALGHFAARAGYFGGEFSFTRMSRVKPGFLWLMHRSGWGRKPGQEVTLAVHIQRAGFDELLRQAVPSSYQEKQYQSKADWQYAVQGSQVRVQWDPDRDPSGAPLARRVIQLGLRGEALARYAREWIVEIEDISAFVEEQRAHVGGDNSRLLVPLARVYPLEHPAPG
ncbi:MAG TPA: DUF4291 domain-containing protein [Ktedonobacteraceae bacterium]|jgi:hypothetical protein